MNEVLCSNVVCEQKQTALSQWNPFARKGIYLERDWFCSLKCLQPAAVLYLRRLLNATAPALMRTRIGAILLEKELIDREQLEEALGRQKEEGGNLGEVLVQLGYVSRRDLTSALSQQHGLPWIYDFDPTINGNLKHVIPGKLCYSFKIFPIEYNRKTKTLVIVVGGPIDITVIHMLRKMLDRHIDAFITSDDVVQDLLEKNIGNEPPGEDLHCQDPTPETICRHLVGKARSLGAHQIKIDRFGETFWVRYRTGRSFSDVFVTVPAGQKASEARQNLPTDEPAEKKRIAKVLTKKSRSA